jgi:tRNA (guanine-N(7)-)-methyltransferase subunit TRM82
MPKRLCAIALTKNQSTILAGDKFGDVYALPLHSSFNPHTVSHSKPRLEIPKPFKPSASELTVHTKGNREALRQQKLQKAALPKKLEPNFEHQLIIGHVSLLTDLVVGTDPSHGSREYILTSDRDEHIRVSRGMPQAHVIDGYCLGHTDFVSRLCITQERPQFLISGGGEPALCIYDWLRGIVVAKANLEQDLKQIARSTPFSELPECSEKRAVSCIQALYIKRSDHREEAIMIIAALEG